MNPDVVKYLLDIKTSIDSIEDFIGEKKDFTLYQNNKQLRRAVERELEIIGEALNRILKIDATKVRKKIAEYTYLFPFFTKTFFIVMVFHNSQQPNGYGIECITHFQIVFLVFQKSQT